MSIFLFGLLYLICLQTGNSEPYASKNLIFVYDVINPGVDYIEFVEGVGKIYNELFQSGHKKIFDKLLVVFPYKTSVETHWYDDQYYTRIEEKMLEEKSIIEQEKTNENVSRVLTGLWKGLYNAEPNSLIYVFTNAKPEDRSIMFAILCAIENKMIEVGFVIQQNYPEHEVPEEYQTISLQSNGLILNVHKDSQIMNFLSTLLTSTKNKVNLMTIDNNPNKLQAIFVDKFLEEITIASWTYGGVGQYISNYYNHSGYSSVITNKSQKTRYLCTLKTKVESYKYISVGDLFINTDINSYRYGLRVFGVSAYNFDYGFSIDKTNCTKSLQKRPLMDVLNYIYISATNKEYGAVFKSCKIIATDRSFAREISLQKITSQHDLYYGTFVQTSPQAFYLQVTAFINGEMIQRMSSFAITPIQKSSQEYENNYVNFSPNYSNTTYYGTANRFSQNYTNTTYYRVASGQRIKFE